MAHHKIGDVGDGELGSWGFPAGGMGGAQRTRSRSAARVVRRRDPHRRAGRPHRRPRTAASPASRSSRARSCRADVVVAATHPKITFLEQIDRAELPADFVARHRALEDAQRHGEGQRRRRPPARVHGEARLRPRGARRHDRARASRSTTSRARSRTRSAGVPRRGRSPTSASRRCSTDSLAPEGQHVVSMFTQWVPHEWAGKPMPAELDAYADRVVATRRGGRAGLHGVDPAPAGDRAVRDGARVRADRRQHLPRRAVARSAVPHAARARLRRLPHADRRAVPGELARPTAAAA